MGAEIAVFPGCCRFPGTPQPGDGDSTRVHFKAAPVRGSLFPLPGAAPDPPGRGLVPRRPRRLRDPRIARRPRGLWRRPAPISTASGGGLILGHPLRSLRVNARQLNSLFKKTFNQSTIEYIGNRPSGQGRELLCFSRDSVTRIAESTGFKSVHYFSRVFKEKEGNSPRRVQKAHRPLPDALTFLDFPMIYLYNSPRALGDCNRFARSKEKGVLYL